MSDWARRLKWLALALGLISAVGAYRYFSIPAELRWSGYEALWTALPGAVLALLAAALLAEGGKEKNSKEDSHE